MNNRLSPVTGLKLAVLGAACSTLMGCVSNPTKRLDSELSAHADGRVVTAPVPMPAGANYRMLQAAESGERPRVYTQIRGMGDPSNGRLLLRADVAERLGINPVQIQRRFNDTIGKTRRYEALDFSGSQLATGSDYVVDAQFVSSTQELRMFEGGVRVAVTRVQLNAKLIHRSTGFPVWDSPVEAAGVVGLSSGDATAIQPGENLNSPEVQQRLGNDYERAIQRAFDQVAQRIDTELRPMGMVRDAEADSVSMLGGSRNGLQPGDEVVIFRARTERVGEHVAFLEMRPVARARCSGVGPASTQCQVVQRHPNRVVQPGDYAVLTDRSAQGLPAR